MILYHIMQSSSARRSSRTREYVRMVCIHMCVYVCMCMCIYIYIYTQYTHRERERENEREKERERERVYRERCNDPNPAVRFVPCR